VIELVLGGARSGKSRYAEAQCLATCLQLHYVATAQALDNEMHERIRHHQESRAQAWISHEEPLNIAACLKSLDDSKNVILIDCLTLWVSNHLMLEMSAWAEQRAALIAILPTLSAHVVLVSNEVGQGIVPLGEMNRLFVDESGRLHQEIAAIAQKVSFVTAGIVQTLKNESSL